MTAAAASPLAELEAAIKNSQPDLAVRSAAHALQSKTTPLEIARAAAKATASQYDDALTGAPRGLVVLCAAVNLFPVMQPQSRALPILQAVAFVAAEKKGSPAKPALVVSGEITHLGRSFLFAVRDGDVREAESIFLGMVNERSEHKMAGDMLFRAAVEDMGEGGRKLMVAVKSWQLVRALGFKDARLILRPAIRYLVRGARDRKPFDTILAALGKEWVDLEGLASGGRPLDEAGRAGVHATASASDPSASVLSTLSLLRDGYAAASIVEGFAREAALRVIASNGYDVDTARALMFTHAARFVLTFSRTSDRLYALFQAALRIRSPEPVHVARRIAQAANEGEELNHLVSELEARTSVEATARVRSYLARGYSTPRLLDVLANYACRDAALANDGINLIFADVCASEFLASKAGEVPAALAKMIASSKRDQTAYESWKPLVGA